MQNIEQWAALIVALVTAGYLAYDKVMAAKGNRRKAEEEADNIQAQALAKTAETAAFFLQTAQAQVKQNHNEITELRGELKALREDFLHISNDLAALKAENKVLREANEWLKRQVEEHLMTQIIYP